jgi:hypothetical protein
MMPAVAGDKQQYVDQQQHPSECPYIKNKHIFYIYREMVGGSSGQVWSGQGPNNIGEFRDTKTFQNVGECGFGCADIPEMPRN